MGTRTYLINGLINGTLTDKEKEIALANPVIVNAFKDIENNKTYSFTKKTKKSKGGK